MTLYRNIGAPFVSSTGERVAKGALYQPTPLDLRRRSQKLRPLDPNTPPPPPPPPAPPLPNPEWPLVMSPELYLRLDPEGPWAAKARELLSRGAA